MRRAGVAVVLSLTLLAPALPVHAEEHGWVLSESEQEGVRFGLTDGVHFAAVIITCKPPAKEARLEVDLDDGQVSAIGSMLARGNGFYVNVSSGATTLFELPGLTQSEFGAAFGLVVTVPVDHKLFQELAQTGALQVKGDGERTRGADAINISYEVTAGKEYARAFVRRCRRDR